MTRLLDTDLSKQTWLSNPSVSAEFIKLSKNRTNLTFFRITLLEKPNPMLKVPLRSVFYSNILLHPSFCGKYIRIQVSSQRNFQDGGDLVLLNEPNVFQTSGKRNVGGRYFMYLNVGRNYSLIRNRSFPPKSGQDPTGTNFTHNRHRFIQSSWVVCMHIWLPVFFIILR